MSANMRRRCRQEAAVHSRNPGADVCLGSGAVNLRPSISFPVRSGKRTLRCWLWFYRRAGPPSAQPDKIRHHSATGAHDTGLILLRAIARALAHPIREPVAGAELLDQPRDVIAAMPPACRALDSQHVEAPDKAANRSVKGHTLRLPQARVVSQVFLGGGRIDPEMP